jgi:hypothetical protein
MPLRIIPKLFRGAFDHAEAEIVHPANVTGDPCFEPRPKLSDQFGLAAVMDREGIGDESIGRRHKRVCEELVSFLGGQPPLKSINS